MCAGAIVVILMNIIIAIGYCATSRESTVGKFFSNTLGQFKFNVYIRYYMLCYFDLTFFAVMKLIEGNDSSPGRRMATIASYVLFTLAMVMPVFFISVICYRFDVLRIKHAKESFNTLILKVDKQSRWRLIVPFYYFFRRILTAVLLSIPISNTFIFLQYVFVLMSSHSYVLYLVAVKPYQTTLFNNYVLANETFYSALIIAIFIFSDATPELDIKIGAAVVLIASVNCMIVANFVMVVVCVWKGRDQLKEDIKQQKLRRAERELMEDEEEEERRQRQ
jgi:signal transduction histidine kinase